jgi:zinc protease
MKLAIKISILVVLIAALVFIAKRIVFSDSTCGYIVAIDNATKNENGWNKVVEALKKKHNAEIFCFENVSKLDNLVSFLSKRRPMYVCFVLKPESTGRNFIKAAHKAMRKIDSDPYGDVIWGVITGYNAEDALKIANAPIERKIKSIATSMGGPATLDKYDSGFASDERSADNFWVKYPGGENKKVVTNGNISKELAKAFSSIPIDYFITSGHATERNWQIIYNQNKGMLVHTKDAKLQFVEPGGKARHDIKDASLKVYVGAGNCLIGHIDSRACMATAWMHTAGVEQFAGYTVPSWYGFMGWGVSSLFSKGHYSLPEAKFLVNERLLWAKSKKNSKFDDKGLNYDSDTFAFYGDPKQRILFGQDTLPYETSVKGETIIVKFKQDYKFPSNENARGVSPIMDILKQPIIGNVILNEKDEEVTDAVLTERFFLIPVSGSYEAGTILKFKVGTKKTHSKKEFELRARVRGQR